MNLSVKAGILLLSVATLGGVLNWTYWKGFSSGSIETRQEWDRERAVLLATALQVEQDNRAREQAHRMETSALEARLVEALREYEANTAALNADFARRLSASDQRAATYRGWSEASAGERDRLAEHAAALDRSLTEGRELVAEYRLALGQCERQLTGLGGQIVIDRDLIGE